MRRNDPRLGRLRSSFTFLENDEGLASQRGLSYVHVMRVPATGEAGASPPDGVGEIRRAGSSGLRDARLFLSERLSEAARG